MSAYKDVEFSGFSFWCSFQTTILGNGGSRSFFVSCDFLSQLQFLELPFASECHTKPSQYVDSQESLSVCFSSNSCLAQLHSWLMHKNCSCFDHDGPTKIPRVMRLAKELTPSSPILRNQTFSPNCAIGFLHLRPSFSSFHSRCHTLGKALYADARRTRRVPIGFVCGKPPRA